MLFEAGLDIAPAMRSCGSDDFDFYGRIAPTLMVFVGLMGAPAREICRYTIPGFCRPTKR